MPLRARRGVGKTSASAGVAQALAEPGHRILLIDFDPHGSGPCDGGLVVRGLQAHRHRDQSTPFRIGNKDGAPSRGAAGQAGGTSRSRLESPSPTPC
ncbi:AAA family ATPase [Streptomyces sp. BV286]|uniref:ParA family protein n=1 Tax=Streptomyces sp. BV286 TaxID=2849672 RepID=UPI001C2E406E|nr:AAA family ATPase [Streptomyces sp. BV286]MBV1942173.1 AAA family ATPase [Streptomyces sp. BV286]